VSTHGIYYRGGSVVNLLYKPRRKKFPHLALSLTLSEQLTTTKYALLTGEPNIMRTVFTIELKCDINSNDDERRKAFIDLLTQSAEQLYGVASMMAGKTPPTIIVSQASREGKEQIPLFGRKIEAYDEEDVEI
jgi:hypothetical protein